jgi:hypothetical protein
MGFGVGQPTLDFAAANPGKLYINGDEPDTQPVGCISPYDYAGTYHDFVASIRSYDPTARFSPAGFSEPNDGCCPVPPGECRTMMHSTGYAEQFYNSYYARYGVVPPVDEWRFHDFGNNEIGDVNTWWTNIESYAAWSVFHGANMVLGSWGFLGWDPNRTNMPLFLAQMRQAMGLLLSDTRINQAAWWSYSQLVAGLPHYLKNPDGTLTQEGQQYATIIPVDTPNVIMVGSSGGHARLRWTNLPGWGVEAEFWVQYAGGSQDFVYNNTNLVAPGGITTPVNAFNIGDRVEGRARYSNRFGAGPWSAFSNIVLMH